MKLTRRIRLAAAGTAIAVVATIGGMMPFLTTKADAATLPGGISICLSIVPLNIPWTCI